MSVARWIAASLALLLAQGAPSRPADAALATGSDGAVAEVGQWAWRRERLPAAAETVSILAVRGDGARYAIGGPFGVMERRLGADACLAARQGSGCADSATADPELGRWPSVGVVLDLDYLYDVDDLGNLDARVDQQASEEGEGAAQHGALWVATTRGLWRVDSSGRLEERSPAAAEEARHVYRVRATNGLIVAGTRAGAFVSRTGRRWSLLQSRVPVGPVEVLDVRVDPADPRRHVIWLALGERLYRVGLADGEVVSAESVLIPGRPAGQAPVDIVAGQSEAGVAVAYANAIAWSDAGEVAQRRWQVAYPVLPPGAKVQRLSAAHAQRWLGTDRGLLRADTLTGPWQRAASPAGSWPAGVVLETTEGVLAVSGVGVLAGHRIETPLTQTAGNGLRSLALREPRLALVHERALAYVGLEPDYFEGLRKGLGRRGWLPLMSIRAGAAYDRDTSDDHDQVFTYGELNDLYDNGSARSRDFEGSITLTWSLPELAYATDAPELSREARQVVGLRDNLLDEVNQLYFDRRRALVALAGFADRNDPEAVALAIRCEELAAGLDAWTGGWFSRQLGAPSPE